eukprot:4564377-Amphidinium_carterae.1
MRSPPNNDNRIACNPGPRARANVPIALALTYAIVRLGPAGTMSANTASEEHTCVELSFVALTIASSVTVQKTYSPERNTAKSSTAESSQYINTAC